MSCLAVNRWLFGKLPAQGDFVTRGLDSTARDALDRWLSDEMAAARTTFPDFEARYDTAPPWNFVDRCESGSWIGGALCASVDRVGRRYPLVMAAAADSPADAAQVSAGCVDALYAALAEGWDADALHAAALNRVETLWQPTDAQWALLGEDAPAYIVRGKFPEGVVAVMLEMAL